MSPQGGLSDIQTHLRGPKDPAVEGWVEERRKKGVPSMAARSRDVAPMGKSGCRQGTSCSWVQGSVACQELPGGFGTDPGT